MSEEKYKELIHRILTSDDPKLDEMCWIKTIENMDDNSLSGKSGYPDLNKPITTRMAILSRLTGKPYEIQRKGSYGPMHAYYSHYENQIISGKDMTPEQKQQAELARSELESQKGQNAKYQKGKVFISGYAVGEDKDIIEIATSGVEKGEIFSVEIDISRDELLARGINPDEIGWKSLEQIKEEQFHKEVRETLLNGSDEIGYVETYIDKIYPAHLLPKPVSKAMSLKMFNLGSKEGIGFSRDIIEYSSVYDDPPRQPINERYTTKFNSYQEASKKQKKEIENRKAKVERFKKKVLEDKEGKYDKKGILYIPKYVSTGIDFLTELSDKPIEIEVTQRELAEAGILPDDFRWVDKTRISAKDIAEADREQALTTTEVGGFKGFMRKLMDKFKGKEEK